MKPMTYEEARQVIEEWADVLAVDKSKWPDNPDRHDPGDNYTIWVGFDSDGPVILIKAARQGNVLQWLL